MFRLSIHQISKNIMQVQKWINCQNVYLFWNHSKKHNCVIFNYYFLSLLYPPRAMFLVIPLATKNIFRTQYVRRFSYFYKIFFYHAVRCTNLLNYNLPVGFIILKPVLLIFLPKNDKKTVIKFPYDICQKYVHWKHYHDPNGFQAGNW